MEIGPLVLEKKMFEGFLPYMGMAVITDAASKLLLAIVRCFDVLSV